MQCRRVWFTIQHVLIAQAEEVVSKGKELSITAAGATYTGAQTSCCSISAWSPAPGSPGTTNAGQRASVRRFARVFASVANTRATDEAAV